MKTIEICDVTLRDGAQGEGISFSEEDKLGIATVLARLGVGMIEAGAPGMNARDASLFEKLASLPCFPAVSAFGQTRRAGMKAGEDPALRALLDSGARSLTVYGKSHPLHAEKILRVTREENLSMIRESVAFLKKAGRRVLFDAEHFFDGYKADPAYALASLEAAAEAGADVLVLCDTNGGNFPGEIGKTVGAVCAAFPGKSIGIHCHNDMGLAVACTLAAVEAGAVHVQGSFTGFGERCGNTSLCQLIPSLQLKLGYACILPEEMPRLALAARYVADVSNTTLPSNTPYVGESAFAHKAGTHVDAMLKLPGAYEHIDPEAVGNERRAIASELAGRAAVYEQIRRVFPEIERRSPEVDLVLGEIKRLERNGWQYESAEASLELLIRRSLNRIPRFYRLEFFDVTDNYPFSEGTTGCLATVKIFVGEKAALESAEGDGPVHALDMALRKCLTSFYPAITGVHLVDYKVRVITPNEATAARVRVLMNSTDGVHTWTTVGTSRDIIRASWKALVDSMEYFLIGRGISGPGE